jgi:hypothetical protein
LPEHSGYDAALTQFKLPELCDSHVDEFEMLT